MTIYRFRYKTRTRTHTKPIPVHMGTGFHGYGYRFRWNTPGLPVQFPIHKFSKEKSKLLAENFSKYIVACCWEKMHRQITHWFSRIGIRSFFLVNRDRLLDHFRTCESIPSTRQDSMLCHFLKEKEKDILDILSRLCPYHKLLPDLGKLVATFESIRASPEMSATRTPGTSATRTPGTGLYTWAICYEFHKLFVSSLIAYGNSLHILSRVHSELGALQKANITPKAQSLIDRLKEKLPNLFEQVLKCVYLVWRITNSHILRHHFKLLQTCHCLSFLSKAEAVPESTVFGCLTRELKLEAVIELEDGNVFNPEPVEGDNESDDEEFTSILDIFHLDKSFMKWMQLLVAYHVGQNILTSKSAISASILQKLNISPVTAIQPSGVDREMEPWDELLKSRHLHFSQDLNVNIIIEAIKNEVKTRPGESCHNIFRKFQLQVFQPDFPGKLHCKMILAVLAQHAQDPVTSSTLGCLAQVWLSLHSNNTVRDKTVPMFFCISLNVGWNF